MRNFIYGGFINPNRGLRNFIYRGFINLMLTLSVWKDVFVDSRDLPSLVGPVTGRDPSISTNASTGASDQSVPSLRICF